MQSDAALGVPRRVSFLDPAGLPQCPAAREWALRTAAPVGPAFRPRKHDALSRLAWPKLARQAGEP